MADLTVIYDPSLQIGAIVDLDTNMGWGPLCPGPEGGNLLQAFVDGMPFDITVLSAEQARDIFLSVFREDAARSIEAQGQDNAPNVDAGPGVGPNESALAQAVAVAAGNAPPEPAPHDADMEADAGQTGTVEPDPTPQVSQPGITGGGSIAATDSPTMTNCLVCNPHGTGSTNPACVVCGGSGRVRAA